MRATASSHSMAEFTPSKPTVETPTLLMKLFSSTRSWATARALAPGATTAPRPARISTTRAGTFSNSKVTTSLTLARAARASGSS